MLNKKWVFIIFTSSFLLLFLIYLVIDHNQLTNLVPPVVDKSPKATNSNHIISSDYSIKNITAIFAPDHSWTATLSAQNKVTLIATGDVGMGRSVNTRTIKYQDWKWPWLKTADFLKNADLTLINLEVPMIKDCPQTDEGMIFCADSRHIEGLKFAGIDVASTANNHYGNWKLVGINESNEILRLNDIIYTKNSYIKPITINSHSLIFLNYNEIGYEEDGIDWANDDKINTEVSEAKKATDIVVVSFHWGNEYTTEITERQKELAHLAIDSGADLIIGNHAHWIQPLEFYKGKLIMYAHGNFIFDQMWSQETREGVVGKYIFYDKKLVDVEFFPVQIDDYGQPHFVEGKQKQRILDNLKDSSLKLMNN